MRDVFHKDTEYGKPLMSSYGHGFYEDDNQRLKRVLSAARAKPPRRVLLRRWIFWALIAALLIEVLLIVWFKWDSAVCRALLLS